MAVKPKPDGYQSVIPYLVVPDAAKEIDFLKAAFGATEMERMLADDGTVRHAEIRIGDSVVMMAQASEMWPAKVCAVYVYVDDTDAAYRRALAAGGTSEMEPATQFYGDRNGGVKDPAGNSWWIATHVEEVAPDELRRRHEEAEKKKKKG